MSANSVKIVAEGLYKVFGGDPGPAIDLLEDGCDKDEIFERTGLTVGVQDASFEIHEGEVFVVMGLSGSGKSTLVRMLNRLIEPSAGTVRIDDEEVTRMSERHLIELRRHDMSMVFQSFALLPNRTVYGNASFGLEVAGVDHDERRERTLETLDAVGLKANADSLPSELSGGMQQRVGLARALAVDPTIMLMDEAFSALDPLIRTEMQDQLLDLQREQARTVLFVSHDLDEALKIGDRIAIMEQGRIVQVGTPAEVLREPANDYVRAFFRGVDVSRVFTMGEVARRTDHVALDGAQTSARRAHEALREAGEQVAAVLGDDGTLRGIVSVASLERALDDDDEARCEDALLDDVAAVSQDTVLAAAMETLARSAGALPVADGDGCHLGLVTRSDMLHALVRESGDGSGHRESGEDRGGIAGGGS